MNSDIRETLSDAEGRYLEPEEQTMLMEYADSLEQRLIIMRDVQATESEIVDSVVETVMEQHPEAVERHQKLRDKTARDVSKTIPSISKTRSCTGSARSSSRPSRWTSTSTRRTRR